MAITVDPAWTRVNNTPNKSVRQNVARKGAVLHHAAMKDLDLLRSLEMGLKQVSSSAIVKNGQREKMMDEDVWRAWSLSSAYWDSALRSVETCNETIEGWTISDESHRSLGRIVAYWAQRDGFWPHRDGNPETWTVIGHREVYTIHGGSYATACPGGMDLNLVVKYAQEFLLANIPNLPVKKGHTMGDRQYYARVDPKPGGGVQDTDEWMIGGVDLFDDPDNDPEVSGYYTRNGYWVTTDIEVAIQWARQWGIYPPDTLAVQLLRDDYINQQAMLEDAHFQWVEGMKRTFGLVPAPVEE